MSIVQYPTAEWARYELRNIPSPNYPIGRPPNERPKKLEKKGGHVFSALLDSSRYWTSGENLVRISCQGFCSEVLEEFVREYLAKYPSSIDESFALPAMAVNDSK